MKNYEFSQQLEKRLLDFSIKVANFLKTLKFDGLNKNYIDQLSRSSTSIGANYIEANESIGPKDFYHRIKICRKESKESIYWFELINNHNVDKKLDADLLKSECQEYLRIFSSIVNKYNRT